MRLTDLEPCFVGYGGEGVSDANGPVPRREGVGLSLSCPCGCESSLYLPFANPLDGGAQVGPQGWKRTGDTFETMTLKPSIARGRPCPARWHGFITNGEITNA